MRINAKTAIAFLVGTVLVTAGCQAAEEDETSTLDTTVVAFFDSLSAADSSEQQGAKEFSGVGSFAAGFVDSHIALMSSLVDANIIDSAALEAVYTEGEARLCFPGHDTPDVDPENFCFIFSDFVVDEGVLDGFQVFGEPVSGQVALRYFSSLSPTHPRELEEAKTFATAGSPAFDYVTALAAIAQAELDGGSLDTRPLDVLFFGDRISLCQRGHSSPTVDPRDFCTEYTNVEVEGNSVTRFDAGDRSIDGLISLGNGSEESFAGQASMKRVVSFETSKRHLIVVVEFTSTSQTFEIPFSTTYIGPDGRGQEFTNIYGPRQLKNGRSANVAFIFAGAQPGGSLELVGFDYFSYRETQATLDAY
jgi:hypothetical protein